MHSHIIVDQWMILLLRRCFFFFLRPLSDRRILVSYCVSVYPSSWISRGRNVGSRHSLTICTTWDCINEWIWSMHRATSSSNHYCCPSQSKISSKRPSLRQSMGRSYHCNSIDSISHHQSWNRWWKLVSSWRSLHGCKRFRQHRKSLVQVHDTVSVCVRRAF